jgi:hypothetical protein
MRATLETGGFFPTEISSFLGALGPAKTSFLIPETIFSVFSLSILINWTTMSAFCLDDISINKTTINVLNVVFQKKKTNIRRVVAQHPSDLRSRVRTAPRIQVPSFILDV